MFGRGLTRIVPQATAFQHIVLLAMYALHHCKSGTSETNGLFFLLLSYAEVGLHLVLPISSFVCSHSGKQLP